MKLTNRDKICSHCDKNRSVHAKGRCRSCYEKKLKEDNPEYHARSNAYQREKRKTPEAKKAAYERHLKRWSDPEYRKKDALRKWSSTLTKYGLTEDSYQELVSKGCQICKRTDGTPHLDHCHETGRFRGLLCSRCNNGLGMLGDTLEGVERAVRYLTELKEQQ